MVPVVVLNGGSSAGKSSIARHLQRLLGPTWMTLGDDDLVRALPGGDHVDRTGQAQKDGGQSAGIPDSIEFDPDGAVAAVRLKQPGMRVLRRSGAAGRG